MKLPFLLLLLAGSLSAAASSLEFIDTSFENASPVWYEHTTNGTVVVHLNYDHERSSSNRAAGHIHILLHATPGTKLTLEFKNLDNIYNGKHGSVAKEMKAMVVSENGRDWKSVTTESLPEKRVRLNIEMPGPHLYVARIEPLKPATAKLWADTKLDPNARARAVAEAEKSGEAGTATRGAVLRKMWESLR
jgi:hypothetical protein